MGLFTLLSVLLSVSFTCVLAVDTTGEVEVVHVITMNHLDVGFNGIDPVLGYAVNVINKYFDVYFPKAIRVSKELRDLPPQHDGQQPQMIYTTHAFLVSLYLDCAPLDGIHCPTEEEQTDFIEAVGRGDITWHAFPFNAEPELADESLFKFGIQLAHDLDKKYNITPTTVMSQRDVPGLTRGVIPILQKEGIIGITVGVNGAAAPPGVPQTFIWKDLESASQILATWNPGGYGAITVDSCVWNVPGLTHALCFEFEGDNAGPPDVFQVRKDWIQIHKEFPNATIIPSTFDSWFAQLAQVQDNLPIVTDEIGDNWIYGCPSDPKKLASFRAINRERKICLNEGVCSLSDTRFYNFSRIFIKNIEHTWGLDIKKSLNDFANWTNVEFQSALPDENYQQTILGWIEQRKFIDWSLSALGPNDEFKEPHVLLKRIQEALAAVNTPPPLPDNFQPINLSNFTLNNGAIEVAFDEQTGSIMHLKSLSNNRNWASAENLLSLFQYQTLTIEDFHKFESEWFYCDPLTECSYALKDDGKFNLTRKDATYSLSQMKVHSAWYKKELASNYIIIEGTMHENLVSNYGAPAQVVLQYEIIDGLSSVNIQLHVVNKTATKLPESGYLSFNPTNASNSSSWKLKKLGSSIALDQICFNGSYHLHGVGDEKDAISYNNGSGSFQLQTLDAAIVTPGAVTPFPTPLSPPDLSSGIHLHLFNNIWGTNYIMWYPYLEEDATSLYRFSITVD